MEDGAAKNRNQAPWNLPALRPKDGEDIMAIVRPFDFRSRRIAKKTGVDYVVLTGNFVDADRFTGGDSVYDEDGNELDFDVVLIGKDKYIEWGLVAAWISVALPDWIYEKGGKDG